MDCEIDILFNSKNIEKYIENSEKLTIKKKKDSFFIENSEKLTIKKESFEIEKFQRIDTTHLLIMSIDSQEKINKLHKIFDFFIKHRCFFYIIGFKLFDIDKNLFHKSGYWFLNSEKYWIELNYSAANYLALIRNDKVVKCIEYSLNTTCRYDIYFDLGSIDFLVSKCRFEMSKKNYNLFTEKLIESAYDQIDYIIKRRGIKFFKCMCKNNILFSLLDYLNKNKFVYWIVYYSIKANQTEIIDYLLKYGLEKDQIELRNYLLLPYLIRNNNVETFMYTIQNVNISNINIRIMIKESGEFITKEYVDILLDNGKLDLENLELLNKSIKNNPNIKLKKYVKNLIFNEKN